MPNKAPIIVAQRYVNYKYGNSNTFTSPGSQGGRIHNRSVKARAYSLIAGSGEWEGSSYQDDGDAWPLRLRADLGSGRVDPERLREACHRLVNIVDK